MKKKKRFPFVAFFVFEVKRSCSTQKICAFAVLIVIALILAQNGVAKFKQAHEKKISFKKLENEKVKHYFNYRIYGSYGFRQMLVPHPLWVFFANSTTVSDITAYLNSGERLNIFKPVLGSAAFETDKNWFTDFSGIVLFFGALIALFSGFEALRNKEYLKFLSSLCGKKRAFFYSLAARAVLACLQVAVITAFAVLLVFANGVILTVNVHLLGFVLLVFLVMIFFLVLGSVFAHITKKGRGMFWALTSWLVLVFVIPTGIATITEKRASAIKSTYTLELEKIKIIMDFEKRMIEKFGKFGQGKEIPYGVKKRISGFLKNEFRRMQSIESAMITEMEKNSGIHQLLSSLFPTSAYISNGKELSGMGYDNLVGFYKRVMDIKAKFSEYILDKVYFSEDKENKKIKRKVEAYLQPNENVIHGSPAFTGYFKWGVICTLLWIAALLTLSYTRYKKSLLHLSRNHAAVPPFKKEMDSGDFHEWSVDTPLLNTLLFNTLANPAQTLRKKGLDVSLFLDETPIENHPDFLYLARPNHLPCDLPARCFLDFVMRLTGTPRKKRTEIHNTYNTAAFGNKGLGRLNTEEMGRVYLSILETRRFKIYLADDITASMPAGFAVKVKRFFDDYCREGSVVLYLYAFSRVIPETKPAHRSFRRSRLWRAMVTDCIKEEKRDEKARDEGRGKRRDE